MSQTRPDLAEARAMLERARRARSIRRAVLWTLGVLVLSMLGALLILQTAPFADVYEMLIRQLGLV